MKGNHEVCAQHEQELAEVTRQREALATALERLMAAAGGPGWALACVDAAAALREAGRK